jgi:hypothetical protein
MGRSAVDCVSYDWRDGGESAIAYKPELVSVSSELAVTHFLLVLSFSHSQGPAQRFRATRSYNTLRNRGLKGEKYRESPTRVLESGAHPGVYNLLGDRSEDETAVARGRGVPPVEHAELLAGPLGNPWPALGFSNEYFKAGYGAPHGPSLSYLNVDVGPQYAITARQLPPSRGVAPNLLTIARAVGDMADTAAMDDAGADSGAGAGMGDTSALSFSSSSASFYPSGAQGQRDIAAQMAASTLRPDFSKSAAGPVAHGPHGFSGIVAAGGKISFTMETSAALTNQSLQTNADAKYDLARSVGQQFAGTLSAPLTSTVDVTSVGPSNAVVTARAGAHNIALMGRTRPGEAPTLADLGSSGGAVFDEGAGGLGAGVIPTVQTVIHPLDAFPATRRVVAAEKVAQIDAEKFRKSILNGAIRRDVLTAKMHPHGALGVDSLDNEASAVYGEAAARRRLEQERAFGAAAAREQRILGMQVSVARRGYDFLRPDASAMASSARLDTASMGAADGRAAARDGVKVRH